MLNRALLGAVMFNNNFAIANNLTSSKMNKNRYILLTFAATLAQPQSAHAQFFKDPTLENLLLTKNYAELEKVTNARIAAKPDDAQAILGNAIIALRGGNKPEDSQRRKLSIANAQACISRQPDSAVCHYAFGSTLGIQAMNEGMLKMASSVGTIKDALTQAVTLDGQWFPARSALVNFYLIAPSIVGGSKTKARETAKAAPIPEHAKALEAYALLNDEQYEQALPMLNAMKPGSDQYFNNEVANWIYGAAIGLVNKGKAEAGRSTFERLMRENPQEPNGFWGMARVHAETGNHAEAIKMFIGLSVMKGSEQYPTDYRLGISYQALGQKDLALAALTKFIASGKGTKNNIEDAKARIEALKG